MPQIAFRKIKSFSSNIIAFFTFLVIWYFFAELLGIQYLIAGPLETFKELFSNYRALSDCAYQTIMEAMVGLLASAIIGFIFAVFFEYFRPVKTIFYPSFIILQSTPIIAFAPLVKYIMIIIFKDLEDDALNASINIMFAFLVSIFPIIINTIFGLEKIPSNKLEWIKTTGATKSQIFLYLRIPQALPKYFDGLQTAVPLSFVGAIVSEMVVGLRGLGKVILLGIRQQNPSLIFASLLILAFLSTSIFLLSTALSKYVKDKIYGYTMD